MLLLFLALAGVWATPDSLDGIWVSKGYGYVFEIKGPLLHEYEVTSTTCVQPYTSNRVATTKAGIIAAFQNPKEGFFYFREGGTQNRQVLSEGITDIQLDRVAALPPVCQHLTENTPPANFQVFARTFAEQYISFDRRHVDWEKTVSDYRSKVTNETSPAELFEILQNMIRPLGDLHTGVVARQIKRVTPAFWRPGTNRLVKGEFDDFIDRGWKSLFRITDQTYLKHGERMFCKNQIQFGYLDDVTGYLRIMSFDGYSRHDDLAALETALDTIFSDRQLRALIIDTRLSFGGSDDLGLAIARRLTDKPYEAFSVHARAGESWTTAVPVMIQPSSRPAFHGRVVQLTGPLTLSASETFTEALMERSPHVTRIGESTQGVFCDVLDRHLPNGWLVGLPNAVYRLKDGKTYDALGVPPDVEMPCLQNRMLRRA